VEDEGRGQGSTVVGRTRVGQSAFYALDEFPTGELSSVEAGGVSCHDLVSGSGIPFGCVASGAKAASVIQGESVKWRAQVLVEVMDVLGGEGSDLEPDVPGGCRFGR
jgi:hypothetical protein